MQVWDTNDDKDFDSEDYASPERPHRIPLPVEKSTLPSKEAMTPLTSRHQQSIGAVSRSRQPLRLRE